MAEINRRDALVSAAVVGVMATMGHTEGQEERPKAEPLKAGKRDAEGNDQADRRRVIAAGMTEAEADCWEAVAKPAGKFFELPKLHPMDDHEVAHAIHVIQNKLLGRPTYRKYLELARAEAKK